MVTFENLSYNCQLFLLLDEDHVNSCRYDYVLDRGNRVADLKASFSKVPSLHHIVSFWGPPYLPYEIQGIFHWGQHVPPRRRSTH